MKRMAKIKPLAGGAASPAPWHSADDGTIIAANGKAVCVLGVPEDDMAEQDVTNGALILAAPELLAACSELIAFAEGPGLGLLSRRIVNAARAAIAKAEGRS